MRHRVIVTGVGGQGVLFASRLLAETARRRGLAVAGAETHGMSQRGGSVVSHLHLGGGAGLVPRCGADLLLALHPDEAVRCLAYLRPASGARLVVACGSGFPPAPVVEILAAAEITVATVDASAAATVLGMPRLANLVALGFAVAAGGLPCDSEALVEAAAAVARPGLEERTFRALDRGLELWEAR